MQANVISRAWDRVDDLFERALALPAPLRAAFLERECAGDTSLLRRVSSLVKNDEFAAPRIGHALGWVADSLLDTSGAFPEHARFEIRRRLGSGGFGAVYEAFDREQEVSVALKVLRIQAASPVAQFKREFRWLADLSHPNLTNLYELFLHGQTWFFTMELIVGDPLHTALQAAPDRIGKVFAQLAEGIQALHEAGVLHCDLKPSNVMVTPAGQVKILDFGLVQDALSRQSAAACGGTPGYASPEQLAGLPLTPSADWYSFGAIVKSFSAGHPALAALAGELLSEEPSLRPTGSDVLALLNDDPRRGPVGPPPEIFVGRESELNSLEHAYREAASGAVIQRISGAPGIGKTTLARKFFDGLGERRAAVFSSRCRNRESVPFKALDEIADGIARFISGMENESGAVLPAEDGGDRARIAALFPRLAGAAFAAVQPGSVVRQEASFDAFARMLRQLAARARVVFWIDDAQWGDRDSAALLRHVLGGSEPVPILIVLSYQAALAADSEFLMELGQIRAANDRAETPSLNRTLELSPLAPGAAEELARRLIAPDEDGACAAMVAAESGGDPYLLTELARAKGAASVEEILARRLESLPPLARDLARIIAVANHPLDWRIARAVLGAPPGGYHALLLLQSSRLARFARSGGESRIDSYHDRAGDAIRALLGEREQRETHLAIAEQTERLNPDDIEALAWHYSQAGEPARSAPHALAAGDRAWAAAAYGSAARFYRIAAAGTPRETRHAVTWKLALACANAGRAREAAALFLELSKEAEPDRAIELEMMAARHFFVGGQLDRGAQTLQGVLGRAGMKMHDGAGRALLSGVQNLAKSWWFGRFHCRRPAAEADRLRMEICRIMSTTYSLIDPAQAADFEGRYLLLTSRRSDAAHRAAALALESGCLSGLPIVRRWSEPIRVQAFRLAEQSGDPKTRARVRLITGMAAAVVFADWRRGLRFGDEGARIIHAECPEIAWELAINRQATMRAMYLCGEYEQLRELIRAFWRGPGSRDDHYASLPVAALSLVLETLSGASAARARDAILGIQSQWPSKIGGRPGYAMFISDLDIELYSGHYAEALDRCRERWPALYGTGIPAAGLFQAEATYRRACAAIGLSHQAPAERSAMLGAARRDCATLARVRSPFARGATLALRAALAHASGDGGRAESLLAAAGEAFRESGIRGYAAAARRHRGLIAGGSAGARLVEEAGLELRREGVVNPARAAQMLITIPGLVTALDENHE